MKYISHESLMVRAYKNEPDILYNYVYHDKPFFHIYGLSYYDPSGNLSFRHYKEKGIINKNYNSIRSKLKNRNNCISNANTKSYQQFPRA